MLGLRLCSTAWLLTTHAGPTLLQVGGLRNSVHACSANPWETTAADYTDCANHPCSGTLSWRCWCCTSEVLLMLPSR